MKKALLTLLTIGFIGMNTQAQNVHIPDTNFKAYLVGNYVLNSNYDAHIQLTEAAKYTGEMKCGNKNIVDLTGIEAFTDLRYLDCRDNKLTSLDVSKNNELLFLYCQGNELTTIDVRADTLLRTLDCAGNKINTMNLNTRLQKLYCGNNMLTSLDLSSNSDIRSLFCQNNKLTILNFRNGKNHQLNFYIPMSGNREPIYDFNCSGNSSLSCVQVDDSTLSTREWPNKDANTIYSHDCSKIGGGSTTDITKFNKEKVAVYPNPTHGNLTIDNKNKEVKRIIVLNLMGEKVLELIGNQNTIDASQLSNGLYLLKVSYANDIIGHSRFIKN